MSNKTNPSRLVLVTAHYEDAWIERLQRLSPDLQVERYERAQRDDIPQKLWQQAEVLYTLSSLPTPEQAPKLRWVQLYSAGANQALESPLLKQGVQFSTMSGVHAINIAEYVLTTILAWSHRYEHMLTWKQRGRWPADEDRNSLFVPQELRGKTINIVGYGSIGREVARMARAFGMRILAMQRRQDHRDHGYLFPDIGDPEGTLPDHYYSPAQLHEKLAESDVVVVTLPLTPHTKGMFDEKAFRAMKDTAFFVNIARGDICDEPALIKALQERWIAGAALDVFHQEPLPSDSPFFHLSNVVMSPHIAGLTPLYDVRAAEIFEENMRRYLQGEPLLNSVDREQGY